MRATCIGHAPGLLYARCREKWPSRLRVVTLGAMTTSPPSLSRRKLRRAVLLPARKPVVRTSRVSLFEREIRVQLSNSAIDILLQSAAVLSEGTVREGRYEGSTMLTIDLGRVSVQVSEACDVATARNVEVLLASDVRIYERARQIAMAEAQRCARSSLDAAAIDLRVRRIGCHFHIDMDVEAMIGERS